MYAFFSDLILVDVSLLRGKRSIKEGVFFAYGCVSLFDSMCLFVSKGWNYGEVMCKATPFLQGVSVSASVNTLMAIAFDR